eukprot:26247-Eustigmatos_ZCMA.PRE.1
MVRRRKCLLTAADNEAEELDVHDHTHSPSTHNNALWELTTSLLVAMLPHSTTGALEGAYAIKNGKLV